MSSLAATACRGILFAGLAALAVLKAVDFGQALHDNGWSGVGTTGLLTAGGAMIEGVIAVGLWSSRWRQALAYSLGFGAVLALYGVVVPERALRACGCLGPVHVSSITRALLTAVILVASTLGVHLTILRADSRDRS